MGNEVRFRIIVMSLFTCFFAHRGCYTRKLGDEVAEATSEREKRGIYQVVNLVFILAFISIAVYLIYPR